MAQTNANAAYAATTLSLATKSMGTAPCFDVTFGLPNLSQVLIPRLESYQNGGGLKVRAAVHPALQRRTGAFVPAPIMVKNQ